MRSLQNFILFLFSFCPADGPKGRRIADAPLESPRSFVARAELTSFRHAARAADQWCMQVNGMDLIRSSGGANLTSSSTCAPARLVRPLLAFGFATQAIEQ